MLPERVFDAIKSGHRYWRNHCDKNRNFSDLNGLIKKRYSNYWTSDHFNNHFYSLSETLKRYSRLPSTLYVKAPIEHGLYGTSYLSDVDISRAEKGVITMGRHRLPVLKEHLSVPVYCIGPYIHYASPLLNEEEVQKEKRRLGRNILVFPSHSFNEETPVFLKNELIDQIKYLSRDFDCVRISLHHQDIIKGLAKDYLAAGFECVTAGHTQDVHFLPRLRSIIECSTCTLSNNMGTHIGYCLGLGKPHHIISQKIDYRNGNKYVIDAYTNSVPMRNLYQELSKEMTREITSLQYELADPLFGLSMVKSPLEMKSILLSLT